MLAAWVHNYLHKHNLMYTNDGDTSSSRVDVLTYTGVIASILTAEGLHKDVGDSPASMKHFCHPFTDDFRLYTPYLHLVLVYIALYQRLNRARYLLERPAPLHHGWVAHTMSVRQRIERLISSMRLVNKDGAEVMQLGLERLPMTTRAGSGPEGQVGIEAILRKKKALRLKRGLFSDDSTTRLPSFQCSLTPEIFAFFSRFASSERDSESTLPFPLSPSFPSLSPRSRPKDR